MAINKVNYNGRTLIDLTEDTVTSETLLEGQTAHDRSGQPITGSLSIDVATTQEVEDYFDMAEEDKHLKKSGIANNLITTTAGKVLDARQGKVLADKLNATQSGLAIIIEGNQTNHTGGVAIGEFVLVRNSTITGITDGLYTAAQAIPANTAIDSTYLAAVEGGGLNAVNSRIATLIKTKIIEFSGLSNSDTSKYYIKLTSNAISSINDNATIVIGAHIVYWNDVGKNIISLVGNDTSAGLNGPLFLLFSKGATFTGGTVYVMFVYM